LGRYPITFDQFDAFAQSTEKKIPGDMKWGRGMRPVINVTWGDAAAYCAWLSKQTGKRYRLPSEAEWEFAAVSGGKEKKWAGTSNENELGDYAWYYQNSGGKTHPVGEKRPNSLGLYDMSGNVLEWVQDRWHDSYDGAPGDGSAWETGDAESRVLRGGTWGHKPRRVRLAYRERGNRGKSDDSIGFRLAQDL
jgi:formylglycine-generating enzyme required for sulfatase activity